jgi:transposase-like protein
MEVGEKACEKLSVNPSRISKGLVALDETCVKVNRLEYWAYVTVDVARNEILSMRSLLSRNALVTKLFVEEVLKCCD